MVDPDAKTATADPEEDYLRRLEKEYDRERPIRKFFARKPRVLQRVAGGGLAVTTALATGQGSPVGAGPINFTVTFSEPATGFASSDVLFTGSSVGGTLAATVTGSGPAYNVAVTGMTGNGTVVITIPAGAATTAKGLPFPASTGTASVTLDTTRPSVTVAAAAGQLDPASISPITFTVTFSEPVTGFLASDVVITGTAGGTKTVSLNGYNAEVTGMTTAGTVIATVPVNAVTDLAGNLSTVSNSATVQWTPDTTRPSVTINKAAGQSDPTSVSPITFTILFNEAVTGFIASDVVVTGPGSLLANMTGSGPGYTFEVTGMNADGNVTASIPQNVCTDLAGNLNFASTSTDNIVQWIQPVGTFGQLDFSQAANSGLQTLVLLEDI